MKLLPVLQMSDSEEEIDAAEMEQTEKPQKDRSKEKVEHGLKKKPKKKVRSFLVIC